MNLNKPDNSRNNQMKLLLILTSVSLVPVYILIGWQSSGNSPATIPMIFWQAEAIAWGIRALVESMALIYLFQTANDKPKIVRILTIFEVALIGLIALTVGLVIIANGSKQSISALPFWLFWTWAFGVAAFAPLMMGSVGFAYKVHTTTDLPANQFDLQLGLIAQRLDELEQQVKQPSSGVIERRQRVTNYLGEGLTYRQMVELEGVSEGTIKNDVKAIRLNGTGK